MLHFAWKKSWQTRNAASFLENNLCSGFLLFSFRSPCILFLLFFIFTLILPTFLSIPLLFILYPFLLKCGFPQRSVTKPKRNQVSRKQRRPRPSFPLPVAFLSPSFTHYFLFLSFLFLSSSFSSFLLPFSFLFSLFHFPFFQNSTLSFFFPLPLFLLSSCNLTLALGIQEAKPESQKHLANRSGIDPYPTKTITRIR